MAWTEKYAKGYRGRYLDAQGKKRTAGSATSKKAALQMAQREELKISGGVWYDPANGAVTLGQYFEDVWWPNCTLEHQTQVSYRSTYKCHIAPRFADVELRKILPTHVQAWVKSLSDKGLSPWTVMRIFLIFQTVLAGREGSSALRDGYIERNPCAGTRLPKRQKREVTIYEPEEVDRLMEAMDPWWRPLVLFMSETGVRVGEAQGVLVGDFTLGFRAVTIQRTIVETWKGVNDNGTRFRTKNYTKTGITRKITLTPECAAAIAVLVKERGLGPSDLLFAKPATVTRKAKKGKPGRVTARTIQRTEAWPCGVPFSRMTFRGSVWVRAHEITGIRQLRVYDLRATNISWLLSGGADLPVVMELAGHTKMETTQKYTRARNTETRGVSALRRVKRGEVDDEQAVARPVARRSLRS